MNTRKKKKFNNKLGMKSFYNYRSKRIVRISNTYMKEHCIDGDNNILRIIDAKRGNLKHFVKIELFTHCYPVSMGSTMLGPDSPTIESETTFKAGL